MKRLFSFLLLVATLLTVFPANGFAAMGDYGGNITGATWYWPFHGYSSASAAYAKITSSYGYRGGSYQRYHKGVDIGESNGTAIYPVRNGTVTTADSNPDSSEGRYVIINHNDGYFSIYMHLSSVNVSVGQTVTVNTKIGAVGGSVYGSNSYYAYHLHLGIHYGSSFSWDCNVNPCPSGYTRIGDSLQSSNGGYPVGSASIAYSVNFITPAAPTNVKVSAVGSKVTVSWNASQNATSYDVYLLQAPWGWEDIKYSYSTTATTHTFTGVSNGDYAAFVIARPNDNSVQSGWVAFTVKNQVPQAPTIAHSLPHGYGAKGGSVKLSWSPVDNAESYTYYLTEYPEGYAYTTNTSSATVTGCEVSFSNLANGKYTAFVHANNSAGRSSQSNWISFYIYESEYKPVRTEVYNGHIYELYDYEMSWSFAKDLCKNMGGHLVTINSADEQEFISQFINRGGKASYWLGATDFQTADGLYHWVTEEPFEYTNWASGEPSSTGTSGTKEHFAEIRKSYSMKWNDVNNINKTDKGFILEVEPHSDDVTASGVFDHSRYLLIDKNTTWTEAKKYCELLDGHLVIIDTQEEKEYLEQFIQNGSRSWYYMGGTKVGETWQWIDGSKMQYVEWAANASNWNGEYLMKYKKEAGCIPLTNTYFPAQHIGNIGFICEIELPYTESTVTRLDSQLLVETSLINMVMKHTVLVAGYQGDQLIEVTPLGNGYAILSGDIDTVKIMAWDSLSDMTALCEAELILESEFLTQ